MKSTLIRGVLVGGVAGLLFGFDTVVISGTTQSLRTAFDLSPALLGWTVSSALWGTLAGALLAGQPGDRFGARACLRAIAVAYIISGIGCALAPSWGMLMVFRVLAGLAIGASSVLAPVYIAEIAPPARRGLMVGAFQFNIVFGILVAYLSNYLIGTLGLGVDEWRWKFTVTLAPALLLFGLLFTIPQSPRWLAIKGRREQAKAVLEAIGAPDSDADIALLAHGEGEGRQRISWRLHRKPILLALGIAAFNQLSGINAILYYLNDIFAAAGFSKVSADQQSVVIGATNLVFTMLALTVIDRVGRKRLLLIGAVGLVVALSGTALIFLTGTHANLLLWMLIGFIAAFAFSQGAVIWVYLSELFPTAVRTRGQSLGSSTHWFMNAVIATLFPLVAHVSKGAPFVFFAVMMAVQFVVVLLYFPETKQVALEDMQAAIE
jgi:MFS transporter, SP family, arabinose:H+ symporter